MCNTRLGLVPAASLDEESDGGGRLAVICRSDFETCRVDHGGKVPHCACCACCCRPRCQHLEEMEFEVEESVEREVTVPGFDRALLALRFEEASVSGECSPKREAWATNT
jgi:hypothetical protein